MNRMRTKKILVTAGPTIEPLDPIRFISNHSTGMMGYAIAAEGKKRGFGVSLISGPVDLKPPAGVKTVNVMTALEMKNKVVEQAGEHDCVIMTAAVCDFRPVRTKKHKIKKTAGLTLELVKNEDILTKISRVKDLVKVGFALETEKPVENGKKKLKSKKLDLIVINAKTKQEDPFGAGKKHYVTVAKNGEVKKYNSYTKKQMAGVIIDEVEGRLR